MRFAADLANWLQTIDYGLILPALAQLPLSLGQTLAEIRGALRAAVDYEFRSLALGTRFVRRRTYEAMRIIRPEAGRASWVRATLKRFVHDSRLEWQEHLIGTSRMTNLRQKGTVEGIEPFLDLQRRGRGLLLVSCHFDSFIIGMCLLGMYGLKCSVVTSHWVEDTRLHPKVRDFYRRKFRRMERYMGGRNVYHETEGAHFYQALNRGEAVILLGDVPGNRSDVSIAFLGRRMRMPLGAWRMAKASGSCMGAFVCVHQSAGSYRLVCLPPREIDPESPENTMRPIYSFLESWIRRMPERWIAADLLPGYRPLS